MGGLSLHYPDLHRFPEDHEPSPFEIPIEINKGGRGGVGILPTGLSLVAVGWLGDTVPSVGTVPAEFIDTLIEAYRDQLLIFDGSLGGHTCEVCLRQGNSEVRGRAGFDVTWRDSSLNVYGHGHHLVRLDKTVYMCPAMILHYILGHDYRPPDEFVKAVREGRFMRDQDLVYRPYTYMKRYPWWNRVRKHYGH